MLARKPLSGTVAANVLQHGTGALNIGGCRLPTQGRPLIIKTGETSPGSSFDTAHSRAAGSTTAGRWPPNVALDEEAAAMLDAQSGERRNGGQNATSNRASCGYRGFGAESEPSRFAGDTGGASRFFYCPKASTRERNAGLGDEQNPHPTVKPIALMRWLVRLITPPGQMVLDPFCGSGSTGIAAVLERRAFAGLEQDTEAVRVAKLRIHHHEANQDEVKDVAPPRAQQQSLFNLPKNDG